MCEVTTITELEIETEFSHLWTKKYWVLVKSDGHFGYSIHDEERGLVMLVERDEIVPYILNKMVKNGCKIYNSTLELPKPILRNKWDSIDEWIAFCKVAKEFKLNQKESDEVARYVGPNATKEDIIQIIRKHIHGNAC